MNGLLPQGNTYREYLVCGGQILFQGIIVTVIAQEKRWAYLGNMMTISFAGALLLAVALIASHLFLLPPVFYTLYFLAVAGLMLLEHLRRVKLMQLGWALSATWVAYRLMVLLLILFI